MSAAVDSARKETTAREHDKRRVAVTSIRSFLTSQVGLTHKALASKSPDQVCRWRGPGQCCHATSMPPMTLQKSAFQWFFLLLKPPKSRGDAMPFILYLRCSQEHVGEREGVWRSKRDRIELSDRSWTSPES